MKSIIHINLPKYEVKQRLNTCVKKKQENELEKVMEELNTCDFHKYQMWFQNMFLKETGVKKRTSRHNVDYCTRRKDGYLATTTST